MRRMVRDLLYPCSRVAYRMRRYLPSPGQASSLEIAQAGIDQKCPRTASAGRLDNTRDSLIRK